MPQFALIIFLLMFSNQISDSRMANTNISQIRYHAIDEIAYQTGTTKWVEATFYCLNTGNELTASGTIPVAGQTLAGDAKLLGKKVIFTKVPKGMEYLMKHPDGTIKEFDFSDTGNPDYISGNRIDIFLGGPEMYDLCIKLGVQKMQIKIYDK